MKELYTKPVVDVAEFTSVDVMTTSTGLNIQYGEGTDD